MTKIRSRPALIAIITVFGLSVWLGLYFNAKEISIGAIGALAALSPKLAESDEVTNRDDKG